ncbi:hypothetical protein [Anaerosporobacter sp.]|uniref:hypothetical protein n=1 Tax=Anaerosporobacter sp. TaxID=1872529 RepID=UPI00286F4383|nr:hypothetical protein [Anaerosporobacter sp.]
MYNKEALLELLDGASEEEVLQVLKDNYNISWDFRNGTCKSWYAKVFTYCNADQLEDQLNFFLWLVNFFAPIFHVCFKEEDTVFLGCSCPCGRKQVVLYYSLTRND